LQWYYLRDGRCEDENAGSSGLSSLVLDGGAELNEEPWSLTSGLSSADWRIVRQHEVQPYHDEADYTVTRGVEDTVESLLQLTSKYEVRSTYLCILQVLPSAFPITWGSWKLLFQDNWTLLVNQLQGYYQVIHRYEVCSGPNSLFSRQLNAKAKCLKTVDTQSNNSMGT